MTRERLQTAFRLQAGAARLFGSTLYADLLEAVREDLDAGGPTRPLLAGYRGDPLRDFLPLRLMGAVHERVLAGAAPELARFYPSVGGAPKWPDTWHAFRDVVATQADALRPRLSHWPQTNEVRRCAALLGGFLTAAQQTGLPLRLREIGASAGLHLRFDRYRYALGPHRWGDPESAVRIEAEWRGPAAPFETVVQVESAAGCDVAPVPIADASALRVLEAYVWADQPERLDLLRAAADVVRADPPRIDTASAADWLAPELEAPAPGVARVVYHSAVWPYISAADQGRIQALIERVGGEATEQSPVVWLSHEHDVKRPHLIAVELRIWPGGRSRRLAEAHPHGRDVRWLDG